MNKTLRIVVAAIMLLAVLILAGNQAAGAGFLTVPDVIGALQGNSSSGLGAPNAQPGTVKPPPVVVPPITGPGTYSVGGICTFRVITLADTISLHADWLPYSTLGKRPQNIASYLAGVCRAIYVQKAAGVIDLVGASDGQIEICFAAVPNTTGTIYVYVDKTQTWTALQTTVQDGLACAPAQYTGKYVLVIEQ